MILQCLQLSDVVASEKYLLYKVSTIWSVIPNSLSLSTTGFPTT